MTIKLIIETSELDDAADILHFLRNRKIVAVKTSETAQIETETKDTDDVSLFENDNLSKKKDKTRKTKPISLPPLNMDDMRIRLTEVSEKLGMDAARGALAKFDVQRVRDLKPDDYQAFSNECENLVAKTKKL